MFDPDNRNRVLRSSSSARDVECAPGSRSSQGVLTVRAARSGHSVASDLRVLGRDRWVVDRDRVVAAPDGHDRRELDLAKPEPADDHEGIDPIAKN